MQNYIKQIKMKTEQQTQPQPQSQTYYLFTKERVSSLEEDIEKGQYSVDVDAMKNIFEVNQCVNEEKNTYKIIHIYKQNNAIFHVKDIIEFSNNEMIAFYTRNNNGEIDKCETDASCIVEEGKIKFTSSTVEQKLNDASSSISAFRQKYGKALIPSDYEHIQWTMRSRFDMI